MNGILAMNDTTVDVAAVTRYLKDLQNTICAELSAEDGNRFVSTQWQDHPNRYGDTRIIEGEVLEKGGVNFSYVAADSLPQAALEQMSDSVFSNPFIATGVSLVMHPYNPFVPTSHMNVRFFTVDTDQAPVWWFGGGFDLTPVYPFDDDCVHWHKVAKRTLDPFGEGCYKKYKAWCDRYFYLPHREEMRGIGGIFFDKLGGENGWSWTRCFDCMKAVGDAYLEAYLPIVARRKDTPFSEQHKIFQKIRRGRYVEFNLLYDRGTRFGLQSKGRTESILMSLPLEAMWCYDFQPAPESEEARLKHYLQPREWV